MSLVSIFEKQLMAEGSYKKKPGFKIKPSSLGTPCMRKLYYDSAQVEPDFPFPLDGKKRMKLGDAIHDMLRSVFKPSGALIDFYNPDGSVHKKFGFGDDSYEFPLECPELYVKNAYIDAVFIVDGKLWIGEYKSINLNGFEKLMNPKLEHMFQAVMYYYVFNKLFSEGKFSHIKELDGFTKAEGVRFLYICKDDTSIKEYIVTESDEFFAGIVEKVMATRGYYERQELPRKTQDWCKSCNWRTKCATNFNDIVYPK